MSFIIEPNKFTKPPVIEKFIPKLDVNLIAVITVNNQILFHLNGVAAAKHKSVKTILSQYNFRYRHFTNIISEFPNIRNEEYNKVKQKYLILKDSSKFINIIINASIRF